MRASARTLTRPSVSPSVRARPLAWNGKRPLRYSRPRLAAVPRSCRPWPVRGACRRHRESRRSSRAPWPPAMDLDAGEALVGRLVGQLRTADAVANGVDPRGGSLEILAEPGSRPAGPRRRRRSPVPGPPYWQLDRRPAARDRTSTVGPPALDDATVLLDGPPARRVGPGGIPDPCCSRIFCAALANSRSMPGRIRSSGLEQRRPWHPGDSRRCPVRGRCSRPRSRRAGRGRRA